MQARRSYLLKFFSKVLFGLALGDFASGAEWSTNSAVAPAVTYTDNVCLDSDNNKGEWIALLKPSFDLNGSGRRANLTLAGSIEFNSLTDSRIEELECNPAGFGSREQFAPKLNALGDAVLLENWFFIDGSLFVDQNEVSAFGRGGGDSLNRTGNTNTTYRYDISPYLYRRLKDVAAVLLRYTYSDEYNTADVVGRNSQHKIQFDLGNKAFLSKYTWGVKADLSKIEYDENSNRATDAEDSELKSARLELGYQIDRRWQINGYIGEEWNDFVSNSDDIDGDFWDLGFQWTPSNRTSIDAGVGNRFFGDTHRFSLKHRHKRSQVIASYTEDLTYDRDIRTLEEPLPGEEFDPLNPTTITNSPILDKRYSLAFIYEGRRSKFRLSGSQSDQTRAEDGRDAEFTRVAISLNHPLSRRLQVSGRLSWNEEKPKETNSEFINPSETWRAFLSVKRQLSKKSKLSFDYLYTDRQSDSDRNEYQENRYTVTFSLQL